MPKRGISRAAWLAAASASFILADGEAARGQEPQDAFATSVRPALEKSCFECHSGKEPEGKLDLARFKKEAGALRRPKIWERVGERINKHEMPPEGSPELNDKDRDAIMGWINANRVKEEDCERLATDGTQNFYRGHVMSRRLSRAEYNNSIRDLTGLDLRPAEEFPSDGSGGEGFDNVGDTLFVSPVLLERYLIAAHQVVEAAVGAPNSLSGAPETGLADAPVQIVFATPADGLAPREAARRVVGTFARRAFRRPVADDEIERLLTMFDRGQGRGAGYFNSVKLALEAVLISPRFLFLVEREPAQEGVYRLGHYELASRLSYFLWASMPDEQLLRLAAEQKLHDDAVLREQVRRMLADPKAAGFAASFAEQWLGIGSLGKTVRPDSERYPEFDDELADVMRAEAFAMVECVLREDRSLLELIDADYTFANARLAEHYGLPTVEGEQLQRVPLEDRNRGGVLGLGAVLTVTSFPLRTSPVLRGKWVLAEVLGAPPAPPPPNAGELPQDDRDFEGLTFREKLEQHRSRPECASCHQTMDPLGFGLENFDAIGRWRTTVGGKPVDAAGTLPSGQSFTNPGELKDVLLARKDEFIRNISRKMLGYALGRDLNQFDDCVITEAAKALAVNDFRSSVLVEQIVLSYPFQHRFAKK